ncbi:helix-turn-helix transcriptional regulator [Nocardioides speluncae]|uniref:helix-turn-helix transcriptional regulator n=1 Tax=Nocardioides speluncae TaxID=2670337 RepID=UPI000D69372E|nr:hypothetical protein [Nocardioides speluncae]
MNDVPALNLPIRDRQRIQDAAMPLLLIRARLCAERSGSQHGVTVEQFRTAVKAQARVTELGRMSDELTAVAELTGLDNTSCAEMAQRDERAIQEGQRMTGLFDITGGPASRVEMLLNARHLPYYFGFGPVRLKVFDRRTVLLDGPPSIQTPAIMLISRPEAVQAAIGYIEVVKSYSVAVQDLSPAPVELSQRQHAVARLVSEGHSDSEIARTLLISGRAVRAEVAAFSEALGAQARFAAGVKYGVLICTNRAFRDAATDGLRAPSQ